MCSVPWQPVVEERSCACSSWPSEILTTTLAQSMPPSVVEPSSGSVTCSLNGTVSVNEASWPSIGCSNVITGMRLPTVIGMFSTPVSPFWSLTVSLAM